MKLLSLLGVQQRVRKFKRFPRYIIWFKIWWNREMGKTRKAQHKLIWGSSKIFIPSNYFRLEWFRVFWPLKEKLPIYIRFTQKPCVSSNCDTKHESKSLKAVTCTSRIDVISFFICISINQSIYSFILESLKLWIARKKYRSDVTASLSERKLCFDFIEF